LIHKQFDPFRGTVLYLEELCVLFQGARVTAAAHSRQVVGSSRRLLLARCAAIQRRSVTVRIPLEFMSPKIDFDTFLRIFVARRKTKYRKDDV